MSDQRTPYVRVVIVSVVVSALVATAFGFIAGLMAGNGVWSEAILSSLPTIIRNVAPSQEGVSAGQESYTLPELRERLKPATQEEQVMATVSKASPAVVSIVITRDVPVYEQYLAQPDDFFSQFFGGFSVPQYRQKGTEKQEVGAGTGFLVSADGYIVTNRHVVGDEAAEYTVIAADQAKYPAQVIGRDSVNDIAILKIEAGKDLPFIVLGDSDQLKVGQSVIAIGFALGEFGNSVSTGIISGLRRQITAGGSLGEAENLFGVIQTDAAINPGNSGGPLLDLKGEAVGVNVAIVQGSQNIGFALPINDIRRVVDSVKATGRIVRPWLGIRYVIVTPEIQKANSLPVDHGALIVRGQNQTDLAVVPGSPADKAGLSENDIILEIGGEKITSDAPLNAALSRYGVGDEVELKVLHRGEESGMTVILAERPQS